jgi:hypothetical protein
MRKFEKTLRDITKNTLDGVDVVHEDVPMVIRDTPTATPADKTQTNLAISIDEVVTLANTSDSAVTNAAQSWYGLFSA